MGREYILSIDQGTTGSTAVVLGFDGDQKVSVLGRHTSDHQQFYPRTGWVEHDLDLIWKSVETSCTQAFAIAERTDGHFTPKKLSGIGISNQRETLCYFDDSGKPLHKAIVWQCKRSLDICNNLKAEGLEDQVRKQTGLFLDPYFTGSKIAWLFSQHSDFVSDFKQKKSFVGTIDTFLLFKLSGCTTLATEASNASRTLLFDIHKGKFSQDLADLFSVPTTDLLPEVMDSACVFAKTKSVGFIPDGIPITGILGDQQAALAGHACTKVGMAKCTYGTGAFLLVNAGSELEASKEGLLTTVAWRINSKTVFALEGACFVAGAAMQFLRDQFNFFTDVRQSESLAQEVVAAPELYFVPSLVGLGAPYWQPKVRGAFLGLTRGTTKQQMIRAGLEGIAFQVHDLISTMQEQLGQKFLSMNVDGGAASNDLLMQTQALISHLVIKRPYNLETTALGAGLFAALGSGILKDIDSFKHLNPIETEFVPKEEAQLQDWANTAKKGWERAIKAVQTFTNI